MSPFPTPCRRRCLGTSSLHDTQFLPGSIFLFTAVLFGSEANSNQRFGAWLGTTPLANPLTAMMYGSALASRVGEEREPHQ
jgi:hypothetical protein